MSKRTRLFLTGVSLNVPVALFVAWVIHLPLIFFVSMSLCTCFMLWTAYDIDDIWTQLGISCAGFTSFCLYEGIEFDIIAYIISLIGMIAGIRIYIAVIQLAGIKR